jgi:hypothetical protein
MILRGSGAPRRWVGRSDERTKGDRAQWQAQGLKILNTKPRAWRMLSFALTHTGSGFRFPAGGTMTIRRSGRVPHETTPFVTIPMGTGFALPRPGGARDYPIQFGLFIGANSMVKKSTGSDAHPRAFVNMANEYYVAANALFELSERRPKKVNRQSEFSDPMYFLYFHTIELALKAYLLSQDVPIAGTYRRRGHPVLKLYEECRELGLIVGPDDHFDIRNIVDLLGNEFQSFRYFSIQSRELPALAWTRKAVAALLDVVAACVEQRFPGSNIPGPAVKADIIFSLQVKPKQ